MSEGAEATSVSLEVSPTTTTTTKTTAVAVETTLECHDETESESSPSSSPPSPPLLPPTKIKTTHTVRKHRKHATTGRTFHSYDGKKIRSALTHKKWPQRERSVSFPTNDDELVTGYLEPANPWERAENVNILDLINSYKASCAHHGVEPLENLLAQLEKLDISDHERCAELSLKHECLDQYHCEPLEELLRRVQFEKIDVESASLDDESATTLFDMLEYYESAKHLNMSSNRNIGARGWQSCGQMIKKTTCLEQFEARDITLTQQHMNILKRPLQLATHLHVLKLENCGLAGRAFVILVAALKMNTGLKELYLADNGLEQEDAIQLGALLRINNHLQLLDISNNHIKDEGARDLLDGLIAQSADNRGGKGLSILVLWNNDLTRASSPHFSEAISQCVSLETLNIGKNSVSNELLELSQNALVNTRTLLQLGMQSTNLTCKGALLLADILDRNRTLQRIDLRDNNIQMEGLAALSFALKRNTSITQLDLDATPFSHKAAAMSQYLDLLSEIRGYCARNEEATSTDESTEESGSPEHRSRLSSVSSRKISLTCQTLPRSPPPSIASNPMSEIARSMLEPKRSSGGRLRSPAPSPVPSPVASPIPSPSRGRFVVSRVCETSLSSTNSSASSSPLTPPSLGSSPTCFFPNTTAQNSTSSSRFRVTVVEAPSTNVSNNVLPEIADRSAIVQQSVVKSANACVTIGFNYKIDKPNDSVDADNDSVFVPEEPKLPDKTVSEENNDGGKIPEDTSVEAKIEIISRDSREDDSVLNVPAKMETNRDSSQLSLIDVSKNDVVENIDHEETRTIADSNFEHIETKVNSPKKRNDDDLRDVIITTCRRDETRKPEPVQRQATSLERLLGLFQHPGSLFSSGTFNDMTEMKNPLQEGVNSMIALGDKFQQYLRDGRTSRSESVDSSPSHGHLQRSASDASRSNVKVDPVKSLSIPQLSNIETTREFVVLRSDRASDATIDDSRRKIDESVIVEASNIAETSKDLRLPENLTTESEFVATDFATNSIDSTDSRDQENSDCSSTSSSLTGEKINQTKLKDIPEYSILEITSPDESSVDRNEMNDEDNARAKCDSSTTDSINDNSFKESSHFNLTCDMSGFENVHTISSKDDVHNFFNSPLISGNDYSTIARDSDDESVHSKSTSESHEPDATGIREEGSIDVSYLDARSIGTTLNNDNSFFSDDNNVNAIVQTADNTLILQNRNDLKDGKDEEKKFTTSDTIEEFLPIDLPSSSIESRIVDDFIANSQLESAANCNDDDFAKNNTIDGKCEDKNDIFKDAISISELTVRIVDSSTREITIFEGTIDDEIQHSIEISTSLSEDSDYSSKISIDDVRTGDISINGSTPDSPAREAMENSIDEQTIVERSTLNSTITGSSAGTMENLFTRKESMSIFNDASMDRTTSIKSSESSDDLIFKITDITSSIDSIIIDEPTVGNLSTTIRISEDDSSESFFDVGQSSGNSSGLFIDTSRNVHRNSQDSGIEETTISISDENVDSSNPQQRENFQESLDSGIDSESSSVCARVDLAADVQKERARDPGKSSRSLHVDGTKNSTTNRVDIDVLLGTKNNDERKIDDRIANIFGLDASNVGTAIANVVADSASPE